MKGVPVEPKKTCLQHIPPQTWHPYNKGQFLNLSPSLRQAQASASVVHYPRCTPVCGNRAFAVDVITMDKSKYAVRVDNIYFLNRIGASLRWATEDIAREELPADITHLLSRLDRLEARAQAKGTRQREAGFDIGLPLWHISPPYAVRVSRMRTTNAAQVRMAAASRPSEALSAIRSESAALRAKNSSPTTATPTALAICCTV